MNKESDKRYPLCWPDGWPRSKYPEYSQFSVSAYKALQHLESEVERLGGESLVISTNQELRRDGRPYSGRREPQDAGVAIYFTLNEKPMSLACDKYVHIWENYRALGKTIEAMRSIERHGSTDLMERAFRGYQLLTGPEGCIVTPRPWREVLGLEEYAHIDIDFLTSARNACAKVVHPDRGGSQEAMAEVNRAYEEGKYAISK